MEYLIYISTAKKMLDDDDLKDILTSSRERNRLNNITGVLLYNEGTFIQLLEGAVADVRRVYGSIVMDSRHKNIIKLTHTPTTVRSFPDWSMGFVALNAEEMLSLEGYFDPRNFILKNEDNHPGIAIIQSFAENHSHDLIK